MTPSKPYLIRALYDWIIDNGCTPHLLVEAKDSRVRVPTQYVKDGSIVLNIAPGAVRDLVLGNDAISFNARFGGVAHEVYFPVSAARMIYARENGQGMSLPEEQGGETPDPGKGPSSPPTPAGGGRPQLRRVK
ncbi:MAG TPA: ClpXP protease specificity-enhancing factor [Gammaproteobacteria bacterium]|nr:ClpXP protease specificity-enhancing factor [Gammaproteobacteria bacterium]